MFLARRVLLPLALLGVFRYLSGQAASGVPALTPLSTRHAASDLEITGVRPGASVFLSEAQLAGLPMVTVKVEDDENLRHAPGVTVQVRGVPLTVLREALHIPPAFDVLGAWCADQYDAHYTDSYLAAHHPILALTIDGQTPAAWARDHQAHDPGPYFITHDRFQVLTHHDLAQLPTNVVRLDFTTAVQAFGPITPANLAPGSPAAQGFALAKQNCLRCHFSGSAGGTKSGRDWQILALWARQKPDYFTGYIHNPRAKDPRSEMPAFPDYDQPTLDALLAYFQAIPAR